MSTALLVLFNLVVSFGPIALSVWLAQPGWPRAVVAFAWCVAVAVQMLTHEEGDQ